MRECAKCGDVFSAEATDIMAPGDRAEECRPCNAFRRGWETGAAVAAEGRDEERVRVHALRRARLCAERAEEWALADTSAMMRVVVGDRLVHAKAWRHAAQAWAAVALAARPVER